MNGNTPESISREDGAIARDDGEICFDEDRVIAFVAGRIDKATGIAFEKHLDTCEACRELVAVLAADDHAQSVSREPSEQSKDAMLRALDPQSLPAGTLLAGRFRIIAALGSGATATTYRVADEKLDAECAVKVMNDESLATTRLVAKELSIARKLNHPNVCRVHDVGEAEGLHFFGMELINGETLEKSLRRGIDETAVLGILDQICAGLEAAHQQEIVHRDLKPANIMIEKDTKRVVLMDFGLAADLDSEESRARIVGTPAYWAPEQARGESPSKASDVYSFGLIAYKMFAGRAFKLSEPDALSHVPRRCRAVIARCLEASPSARYADASAVRAALHSPPRSRAWFAVAAMIALAGIGAFVFTRENTAKNEIAPPSQPASAIASATSTAPLASTPATVSAANEVAPAKDPASASASGMIASDEPKPKSKVHSDHALHIPRPPKSAPSVAKSIESAAPPATSSPSNLLYKQ